MDKFTVRDFLVFFLTGLSGVILLSILYYSVIIEFIYRNQEQIKEINAFVLLLTLPIVYLLGHFISSIEDVFFTFGKYVKMLSKKFKIFKPLSFLINGHRVQTILLKFEIDSRDFWKMYSKVQLKNMSGPAEYWHIMSDLFKNIFTIIFCMILYSFWWCDFKITLFYVVIGMLSWLRTEVFSRFFVTAILDINSVLPISESEKNK